MFIRAFFLFLLFWSGAVLAVPIQTWTLPNGARVLFVESREIPIASMRVSFDAGSARDPAALPGLASFTAGVLDEGAGDLSGDAIAEALDRTGGTLNAFADHDQAGVQIKSLVEPALRNQVADLAGMVLSRPRFPEAAMEREKRRTVAAIAQSEENPGAVANRVFFESIYGGHPYGHPVIGTREAVPHFTRQAAQDFHKQYYVGANAVVAVVGALTRAEAQDWVQRVVGRLPQGTVPAPLPVVAPTQMPRKLYVHMPVNQTYIVMGQPAITRASPDYFPLLVGNYTLGGGGFASRLMAEVREKRGLSYNVYSYFSPFLQAGPFASGSQTATAQAGDALSVMEKTLVAYVRDGPSPVELKAAKAFLSGSFPLRIDSNGKILEYLSLIGFYRLPLDYLDTFQRRIAQVSPAQIRAALAHHLHPEQMTIVAVGSQAPQPDFVPVQ